MRSGLDDVIAADTVLSDVDGNAGRLIIRGASLDDLAGRCRYEDVLSLLLSGFFDDLPEPERLPSALGAARLEVFAHLRAADQDLPRLSPIEAVRALIARIGDGEEVGSALRLIAA